jgi:chorismate--pyruvate lyase
LKHPRASSWFRPSELAVRRLDPAITSWLLDQDSLTRRLQNRCQGQFSVRVLSQQWVRPEIEESRLLGLPLRQKSLLRQVQLVCDNRVLVYARSIIPLKTLRGRHRRLRYLGNKPLGGYLFANPTLSRNQQRLATIHSKDPLFAIALADNKNCTQIWGRRSLFTINGKSLLVSEFFLPELFQK